MANLTSKQKQIIQSRLDTGKPLTGTFSVSLGVPLQADLVALIEDNPDRFTNVSQLLRDIVECYKRYGVDWRNNNDSQFEKIMAKLENLRTVSNIGKTLPIDEAANDTEKKIDASGGFSEGA